MSYEVPRKGGKKGESKNSGLKQAGTSVQMWKWKTAHPGDKKVDKFINGVDNQEMYCDDWDP